VRKPWPAYVAAFMSNDLRAALKRRGRTLADSGVSPAQVSLLLRLNYDGVIDRKMARATLDSMLESRQ
jgi:Asp-tRNA(Asn)/Glu-tRNA(Gln) amidotransferase B subunit